MAAHPRPAALVFMVVAVEAMVSEAVNLRQHFIAEVRVFMGALVVREARVALSPSSEVHMVAVAVGARVRYKPALRAETVQFV